MGKAGRALAKHSDPFVPLGLYSLYASYGACTRHSRGEERAIEIEAGLAKVFTSFVL